MPVYPPSSTSVVLFHLQLKTLLVPPQGAFSRRCLRSHHALLPACLLPPLLSLTLSLYVLRFFPSSFFSSPLCLSRGPRSFRGGSARARASTSWRSRASWRGVVSSRGVREDALRLDRAAQNPTARICVRS